jgi:hypothetical protein
MFRILAIVGLTLVTSLFPQAQSDRQAIAHELHDSVPLIARADGESCLIHNNGSLSELDLNQEPKTGCCCLLKDDGPPLVWDCTGYKDGTLVTEAQCKKDADDTSTKYKWHEGKCTNKD